MLRVLAISMCLSLGCISECLGQFQWNWRDPLDLNHFDWGDNKLLLYNGIGLSAVLKFTKSKEDNAYRSKQFRVYVDFLSEYSRPPISDVFIGRLRWTKEVRSFLEVGGDLSLYKVDDIEVSTAGVGAQIVFNWILLDRSRIKLMFDNGVGPNIFREAFPFGGTQFNFSTFYGLTAHIKLPAVGWITIGAKNLHISNAGIRGMDRNPALDAWGLSVGYVFY